MTYVLLVIFVCILLAAAAYDLFGGLVIPDWITWPLTLIGVAASALVPLSLYPAAAPLKGWPTDFVNLSSGFSEQIAWLDRPGAAVVAFGLWCLWIWAVIVPPCSSRRGIRRGLNRWLRWMKRILVSRRVWLLVLVGVVLVPAAWIAGGNHFLGLLTGLTGLAVGLLTLWSVRIAGWYGAGREAMGFADVLLLGGIGTWLGWQLILPVIIASTVIGLVLVVIARTISGTLLKESPEFAFGPMIALGAVAVAIGSRLQPHLVNRAIEEQAGFVELLERAESPYA